MTRHLFEMTNEEIRAEKDDFEQRAALLDSALMAPSMKSEAMWRHVERCCDELNRRDMDRG